MEIKLEKPNHLKTVIQRLHDKLEDLFFAIILKCPEKMISAPIMNAMGKYLDRKISQTKQQIIKSSWREAALDNVLADIRARQDDKK